MKNLRKIVLTACLAVIPMQSYASAFSFGNMMSYASSMMSKASSSFQNLIPANNSFLTKASDTISQGCQTITEMVPAQILHGFSTPYSMETVQKTFDNNLIYDDFEQQPDSPAKSTFMEHCNNHYSSAATYGSILLAAIPVGTAALGYQYASTGLTLSCLGMSTALSATTASLALPAIGLAAAYTAAKLAENNSAVIAEAKKKAGIKAVEVKTKSILKTINKMTPEAKKNLLKKYTTVKKKHTILFDSVDIFNEYNEDSELQPTPELKNINNLQKKINNLQKEFNNLFQQKETDQKKQTEIIKQIQALNLQLESAQHAHKIALQRLFIKKYDNIDIAQTHWTRFKKAEKIREKTAIFIEKNNITEDEEHICKEVKKEMELQKYASAQKQIQAHALQEKRLLGSNPSATNHRHSGRYSAQNPTRGAMQPLRQPS